MRTSGNIMMADRLSVLQKFVLLFWLFLRYSVQSTNIDPPEVFAIVAREEDSNVQTDGALLVYSNEVQRVLLVGKDFHPDGQISFTSKAGDVGSSCDSLSRTESFKLKNLHGNGTYAEVVINFADTGKTYYLCTLSQFVKGDGTIEPSWVHAGAEEHLSIVTRARVVKGTLLPIWLQACFIAFLLTLSGLFSGLNLGLMALDKTELKIIEKCGSKNEKKYAKTISPVRKRGNFLLCTLLLGNVLVNNSLTILLDDLSNGLFAVIGATLGIVIFGEIVPQAICSRHGLAVGARTIWITRIFMILTFPLSFPISLLLDKILGEEIGNVYNREKLRELVTVTKDFNDLKNEEVNIIAGALDLSNKCVTEVMTKIEDVYMLDNNAILDFETVSEIMKRGYTRIPVYENDKNNIVALLNIKDLALIDPDDRTPMKTVIKFYQHPLVFAFDDEKLDVMLQRFRQGHSHMAIVRCVNNEGEGDPFYETLGVVTLEDVIEEIIQSEIVDETDEITDNRKKAPRKLARQDFREFNQPDDLHTQWISPQLALATFQFLSTSVDLFHEELISETVLKRLIKQNIVEQVIHKEDTMGIYLFRENVPCDYFVLILQGHVEVTVGKDKMSFSSGPFSFYGVKALQLTDTVLSHNQGTTGSDSLYVKSEPYIPDFTVRADSDLLFLRIRRAFYIAARRSTLMGRSVKVKENDDEAFNKEWKKARFLTNLSGNCDPNSPYEPREHVALQQDMRRTSSLTVPFTDIHNVKESKDSSNWSVPENQSNGITLENLKDVASSPKRERSETDPPIPSKDESEKLLMSESRLRSGTAGSGDSLGWESKQGDMGDQHENMGDHEEIMGEQVPLIEGKKENTTEEKNEVS
ncbi:hypothetical protein FSP39_018578 [Pinctada imbricata]|uniref:Uncharacterized protein n=1 Tax=Pinctada imbricata TaxID=66713 RepID=A0AA88YFL5_PINIB|nr:hypothetical protein FSP39_018578 [Pinctada imbricata]